MPEASPITTETPARPTRWKHGTTPVIGLIGGIGGGKSAASALLAERGAVVIDADAVGHEVLDRSEIQKTLVERFGSGILATEPGAKVDRRALGKIVFADPSARRDLEGVVHPVMVQEFKRTIAASQDRPEIRFVVLDAAILLESGWDVLCDLVVYVDAPRSVRLARVQQRRGWSLADFEARESAQWSCELKERRADYVLPNMGDLDELIGNVDRFTEWLSTRSPDVSFLGDASVGSEAGKRSSRPDDPHHGSSSLDPSPL